MRRILVAASLIFGLGFFGTWGFADDYAVNGRMATQAQAQFLVPTTEQPGAPTNHVSARQPGQPTSGEQKCWYVLDVLLCD